MVPSVRRLHPLSGLLLARRRANGARRRNVSRAEGLETYVGGVAAYSTLGWFDDPLLSTFIHWPEAELAELLIHETAHRRLWVADDVPLNEAFASFVGEEGARQWFAIQGRTDEFAAHGQRQAEWRRLTGLLMEAKTRLAALYGQTRATDP